MAKFISREERKEMLMAETFTRRTVSFYRYVKISNPEGYREKLLDSWGRLGVFGRTYVAHEGVNAQISVPEHNWSAFIEMLNTDKNTIDMPLKIAVDDDGKSFYKLTVKVREKIVADGLDDDSFDVTNVGQHLDAETWNNLMDQEDSIVVDMRNHYESEVGHFEGAICPDADTFREELPIVEQELKGNEDKKIMLYCTGGVRCEKASAYLKAKGFEKVHQLHGGIISYAHQIKEKGIESKFKGKNFVFDERLGEKITDDILSNCHQCGQPSDDHTNCRNDACHLLFIQCDACEESMQGCCSDKCIEIANLPIEEQRKIRKESVRDGDDLAVYKSRIRPQIQR
jgi:UPF0176 protein